MTNNISTEIRASAIGYARKAGENKELMSYLEKQANAKVEQKGSAAHTLFMLLKIHGTEELSGFPIPGEDKDKVKGTNRRPDLYEEPATRADGTIQTIKGSFYKDYFENTPMGSKLKTAIEYLGQVTGNKQKEVADDNPYKTHTTEQADRDLNKAKTKYNYALDVLRKSMALFHKWQEVESLSVHGIEVDFAYKMNRDGSGPVMEDGQPVIADTTLPITITGTFTAPGLPKPVVSTKAMSVGAFMALNVPKAIEAWEEKKGTPLFGHLLASNKRGTKKTTPKATDTPQVTFTNLGSAVLDIQNFLDDKEHYGKLVAMFADRKNDDVLMNLAELSDALDGILSKFERRIADLRLTKANGEDEETKAA